MPGPETVTLASHEQPIGAYPSVPTPGEFALAPGDPFAAGSSKAEAAANDPYMQYIETPTAERAETVPGHNFAEIAAFRDTAIGPEHEAADAAEAAAADPGFYSRPKDVRAFVETIVDEGRVLLKETGINPPTSKKILRRWTSLSETKPSLIEDTITPSSETTWPVTGNAILGPRYNSEEKHIDPWQVDDILQRFDSTEERMGKLKLLANLLDTPMDMRSTQKLIQKASIDQLLTLHNNGHSGVSKMIDKIIDFPFSAEDSEQQGIYELPLRSTAMKLIEGASGQSALSWREKPGTQGAFSELAKKFVAKGNVASTKFFGEWGDLQKDCVNEKDAAKIEEYHRKFLSQSLEPVVRYALDIPQGEKGDAPEYRDKIALAGKCFNGDFKTFGYDMILREGKELRRINTKGLAFAANYIKNVEKLGSNNATKLHERFGLVNFGRYHHKTLEYMSGLELANTKGRKMSVMIAGQTGDHNAAYLTSFSHKPIKDMIIFEVETSNGLQKAARTLKRLEGDYRHLTIAGHGARAGLQLSQSMIIGQHIPEQMSQHPIFDVMQAMNEGKKEPLGVTLISCSQGKKFSLMSNSMAKSIHNSAKHLGIPLVLSAAPEILATQDVPDNPNEVFFMNYPEPFNTGEMLRRYGKIPGAKAIIERVAKRNLKSPSPYPQHITINAQGRTTRSDGPVKIAE